MADLEELAREVLDKARERDLRIATAESCTGGLVAAALTAIPGSSEVFDRGFVTYSNAAKADMLGVDPLLIVDKGAVSAEVARAMALGALRRSKASLAVSITGIAGPGGGTPEKPVGLVHFGCALRGEREDLADAMITLSERRFGDLSRAAIRAASAETALSMLLVPIETQPLSA